MAIHTYTSSCTAFGNWKEFEISKYLIALFNYIFFFKWAALITQRDERLPVSLHYFSSIDLAVICMMAFMILKRVTLFMFNLRFISSLIHINLWNFNNFNYELFSTTFSVHECWLFVCLSWFLYEIAIPIKAWNWMRSMGMVLS